jgi:DDE family transposase
VHSADGWRSVLEPVIARYRGNVKRLYFRGDAAFANPEMYEFLEAEGIGYTIRLPANRVLQDSIGYLLKRPVGRPPHEVRFDEGKPADATPARQATYSTGGACHR